MCTSLGTQPLYWKVLVINVTGGQHHFGKSNEVYVPKAQRRQQVHSSLYLRVLNYILWHRQRFKFTSYQFSSVAQLCLTLCSHIDCSMPGFPVHHQLPEPAQTHVHRVGHAIQPSHPVVPFSSCLQSFPPSGSFSMSPFFTSGDQSIGASSSASVLPMNIQDWFPLRWADLITLWSKGLSRVFSNTIVQRHQFFGAQLSSWSNSPIYT